MEHTTLKTATGLYVDPLDLKPSDIRIVDIAHSLARICRFGGHCGNYWSVASHSVEVAQRAWRRHQDATLALQCLIHDGSEAYLGDVIRPLKQRPEFAFYRDAEDRAMTVIAAALDVPWPPDGRVHEYDNAQLDWEINHRDTLNEGLRTTRFAVAENFIAYFNYYQAARS